MLLLLWLLLSNILTVRLTGHDKSSGTVDLYSEGPGHAFSEHIKKYGGHLNFFVNQECFKGKKLPKFVIINTYMLQHKDLHNSIQLGNLILHRNKASYMLCYMKLLVSSFKLI